MWEVRTQFSKQNAEMPSGQLEWNSVLVDTQAEADTALRTRTARRWTVRSYLQCIANAANLFASMCSAEDASDSYNAEEMLLLVAQLQALFAVQNSALNVQLQALDVLERNCLNKLSSFTRDSCAEDVYDVLQLFRNDEL